MRHMAAYLQNRKEEADSLLFNTVGLDLMFGSTEGPELKTLDMHSVGRVRSLLAPVLDREDRTTARIFLDKPEPLNAPRQRKDLRV